MPTCIRAIYSSMMTAPSSRWTSGSWGGFRILNSKFLAEILHGLITRDFRRAAAIHFEAGYVPPHHSIETFAQAMRAIGEPIHGRTAEDISMADLLGQLFAYTELFDMETRPELILLQKSMVIARRRGALTRSKSQYVDGCRAGCQGVGRTEPRRRRTAATRRRRGRRPRPDRRGRAQAGAKGARERSMPSIRIAKNGARLDKAVIRDMAKEQARAGWWSRLALWVGAHWLW